MKALKIFYCLLNLTWVLFFSYPDAFAQTPEILWESFYDGELTGKDVVNDIITDNENNVYVTGKSYHSFSGGDFTTVKFGSDGALLWADHYINTQPSYSNYGRRLVIDKWQNVYSVGTTALHDGDLAVCKYSSSGRIWAKYYEPYWFSTYDDFGIDIDVDSAGNFYSLAQVTSPSGNLYDMYLMKCDSGGNKLWDLNYTGASDADYPVDIEVTPDGTAYTLLQQFNFFGSGTRDIATFQYTTDGVQNWFSNYNGPGNGEDYPVSMKIDEEENQYVCGTTDAGANDDMVIIKQNIYGTRLWVHTYNGTANGNDTAIAVNRLPNGFAVATGRSKELYNSNIVDAIVTMVIDSAVIVWTNVFYGTDSLGALPYDMITDAQGNIYICGLENLPGGSTNGCLIKYNSEGNLLWNISYDAGADLNDKFTCITLNNNDEILVGGQTFTSPANSNYLIVQYSNKTTGISSDIKAPEDFYLAQNYPNPFNPSTKITFTLPEASQVNLTIFNILGEEVKALLNENREAGHHTINFDGSGFSSGVYLYKIATGNFVQIKKMILNK